MNMMNNKNIKYQYQNIKYHQGELTGWSWLIGFACGEQENSVKLGNTGTASLHSDVAIGTGLETLAALALL